METWSWRNPEGTTYYRAIAVYRAYAACGRRITSEQQHSLRHVCRAMHSRNPQVKLHSTWHNIASATHNSINWCKTCITPHDLSIKLADLRSQIHVTCFTPLSRILDLKYFYITCFTPALSLSDGLQGLRCNSQSIKSKKL